MKLKSILIAGVCVLATIVGGYTMNTYARGEVPATGDSAMVVESPESELDSQDFTVESSPEFTDAEPDATGLESNFDSEGSESKNISGCDDATFIPVEYDPEESPDPESVSVDGALYVDDENHLVVYDGEDLPLEVLQTRTENGWIVIERNFGRVTSIEPHGRINGETSDGYYICYSGVTGVQVGSEVVTYFVYNPYNNYTDDIFERWDYVLS